MPFEIKPFRELIAMSKEKLDEAMAPLRARAVRAKADIEMSKIEGKLIELERDVQEMCIKKEVDFECLFDALDEAALLERRLEQYKQLLAQLFPELVQEKAAVK